MTFQLPDEVISILQRLKKSGFDGFVVGGAVLDLLTGRPVDDWDFTTNAVPEEIQKAITHWSQWIDYWATDWDYKNGSSDFSVGQK